MGALLLVPGAQRAVGVIATIASGPLQKFITELGDIQGAGERFPATQTFSAAVLPALGAAQKEGFSFTVPKEALLVNADRSSLV